MSKRASPTLVGGFVVGAVTLAVVAVAVIGSGHWFRHAHAFVLHFDSDVSGLKVGAPVKFKGVEIGSVREILLQMSSLTGTNGGPRVRIPVVIELDEKTLRDRGLPVRLEETASMQRAIEAGLRGQLAMESFVTGLLYVKLDMVPGSPDDVEADSPFPHLEIPTLPTPLEEAQMKLNEFIEKFRDADIPGLIAGVTRTVNGLDALVNSPVLKSSLDSLDRTLSSLETTSGSLRSLLDQTNASLEPLQRSMLARSEDIGRTLASTEATLEALRTAASPEGPVVFQFHRTLTDISETARALRSFLDYLDRDPAALVRGKAAPEAR